MEEKQGLIGMIFDLSFENFVTVRVIKALLILAMIFNAIWTIAIIVMGFKTGVLAGIVILILSPIIYLLLMLIARIYLELIIVFFRVADELKSIRLKIGGTAVEKLEE
ncbi:MAG TPA: DUF4282 domain-containing protein [bacterium]|nr:DUF4282 domain-containing protein [bacterium]HPQ65582.1 DUF4282 domain-containing protein [bacterium]